MCLWDFFLEVESNRIVEIFYFIANFYLLTTYDLSFWLRDLKLSSTDNRVIFHISFMSRTYEDVILQLFRQLTFIDSDAFGARICARFFRVTINLNSF